MKSFEIANHQAAYRVAKRTMNQCKIEGLCITSSLGIQRLGQDRHLWGLRKVADAEGSRVGFLGFYRCAALCEVD